MNSSRLGIGMWGLAGEPSGFFNYGQVSEAEAFAVLDHAWAAHITKLDVADSYGNGAGRARLSKWQRDRGQQFQVALKIGRPYVDGVPVSRLEMEYLQVTLELNLSQLGSSIASVLIKDPPREAIEGGLVFDILQRLERTYPELRFGISTHHIDLLGRLPCCERRVAEIEYHFGFGRRAAKATKALTDAGWRVWGMQPLLYGFFRQPKL